MSLLYGDPGVGKTLAARYFLEHVGDMPNSYLVAGEHPSLPGFARDLAADVTGIVKLDRETLYSLKQLLRGALWTGNAMLIVIDEIDRLGGDHWEFLRDLHDNEKAAFAVLLVGNHRALKVVEQKPMVRSRLLHVFHFEPLTIRDMLKFLPRYHPIFANSQPAVLRRVADASKGRFRWLAMFTLLCEDFGARAHVDVVDERLMNRVLRTMH
jgi:Cdc6-like AAA superfamily ATPase